MRILPAIPVIRPVLAADLAEWTRLRRLLWPDSDSEHEAVVGAWLASPPAEQQVFVLALDADQAGRLGGFLEANIRRYAEGCDTDRVGYIEGWYVAPEWRGAGWGRALVRAAEDWARTQGCREMASDTEVGNRLSRHAHIALGYAEVETIVCFRKPL